jgi:adenine-specific DNA-methyltransferase
MKRQSQKEAGAYYTPDPVVASLIQWVVQQAQNRMLDPSCGDGRFIAGHHYSVGVEQNGEAVRQALTRAPWARVYKEDFFTWASTTSERFECAAGNPPFIRYQSFKGEIRDRALRLCSSLGVSFTGLTSSWAPFLVGAASLLLPGGRMAFVVPAEIGHAPYAAPLLEYLVAQFAVVHIVAVRDKFFPELSEDCWLLYAQGFGAHTTEICFSVLDTFVPMSAPPQQRIKVSVHAWREAWHRRLRPFIIPAAALDLYREVVLHPQTRRFGEIASIGIGYVTGANDFFHLRPSDAALWDIPEAFLHPTVRNGRVLPPRRLTATTVEMWCRNDDPVLLLHLPKRAAVPAPVRKYLDTEAGHHAREAYKCRMREPWYVVPDVQVPDFFLTYMSGREPNLVRNDAGCTCTNSVHSVRVHDCSAAARLVTAWKSPFLKLSCEMAGHPLGGGMLKLEPGEANQIVLPPPDVRSRLNGTIIEEAITTMRAWRHYAPES